MSARGSAVLAAAALLAAVVVVLAAVGVLSGLEYDPRQADGAPQWWWPSSATADGCLPPRQVVFVHHMRTGGTSLGTWLGCICTASGWPHCAVARHDVPGSLGDEACRESSVLTTHAALAQIHDLPWRRAPVFVTVLRHPVPRVCSFYLYMARVFKPLRQRSLSYWLLRLNATSGPAESARVARKGTTMATFQLVHLQLNNAMTRLLGAPLDQTRRVQVGPEHLRRAVASLDCFAAVGFTNATGDFTDAVLAAWPLQHKLPPPPCPLPYDNAADPRLLGGAEPDPELARLIEQRNELDLELFVAASHWKARVDEHTSPASRSQACRSALAELAAA